MSALHWVSSNVHQGVPSNAVVGGRDKDGSVIYVGRAFHAGDFMPGKIIPQNRVAYVCWDGKEHNVSEYEVLVQQPGQVFQWVQCSGGAVCPNAVEAGKTKSGQKLYVGRTHHNGTLQTGKIHPANGCFYFGYNGKENSSRVYEALVATLPRPSLHWVSSNTRQPIPRDAVLGGKDLDGGSIYVGRAFHAGDFIPAKIIPKNNAAYVAYNGKEHLVTDYEVLIQNRGQRFQWVQNCGGKVPPNAVDAGKTNTGEKLYVGRTHHSGTLTVGKIHPSHGCLFIPFNGTEMRFTNYEVLILN